MLSIILLCIGLLCVLINVFFSIIGIKHYSNNTGDDDIISAKVIVFTSSVILVGIMTFFVYEEKYGTPKKMEQQQVESKTQPLPTYIYSRPKTP